MRTVFTLFYGFLMRLSAAKVFREEQRKDKSRQKQEAPRTWAKAFTEDVKQRLPGVLGKEAWQEMPTFGNRHNVFLAALTIAGFQAFKGRGYSQDEATRLIGKIAWNIYVRMVKVPYSLSGVLARDPQERLVLTLKLLMRFPFNAPGKPGYEVKAWREGDSYFTFWTNCPPLEVVRAYVKSHGDGGELAMFQNTWCAFDAAIIHEMVPAGSRVEGHYERPHTMSRGDSVCDMCWQAERCKK